MPDTPYFTVEEFKTAYADDDEVQAKSDDQIDGARLTAEEIIEGLNDNDDDGGCHQAFVPRTETFHLSGDGRTRLSIPRYRLRSVTNCTIGGQAIDTSLLSLEGGSVYRSSWPRGFSNIAITVTHGMTTPPRQIKEAAVLLAYHRLIKGPIDDRATGIPTDGGVITLAVPGRGGSNTGIPEVDKAIRRYQLPLIRPVSIPVGEHGRDYPPFPVL